MVFWHPRGWTAVPPARGRRARPGRGRRLSRGAHPAAAAPRRSGRRSGHWGKFPDAMFARRRRCRRGRAQAGELPGPHPDRAAAGAVVARPADAARRVRPRAPRRGERHAARPDAAAAVHPGRRPHLLHRRAGRRRGRAVLPRRCRRSIAGSASTTSRSRCRCARRTGSATTRGGTARSACSARSSRALGLPYEVQPGAGAIYGPKLEFVLRDRRGRAWQCGTIQLDFVMPQRFDVRYVDARGERRHVVMLHRALLRFVERFLGILLEHHGARAAGVARARAGRRCSRCRRATREAAADATAGSPGAGLRSRVDTEAAPWRGGSRTRTTTACRSPCICRRARAPRAHPVGPRPRRPVERSARCGDSRSSCGWVAAQRMATKHSRGNGNRTDPSGRAGNARRDLGEVLGEQTRRGRARRAVRGTVAAPRPGDRSRACLGAGRDPVGGGPHGGRPRERRGQGSARGGTARRVRCRPGRRGGPRRGPRAGRRGLRDQGRAGGGAGRGGRGGSPPRVPVAARPTSRRDPGPRPRRSAAAQRVVLVRLRLITREAARDLLE